MSDFYKTTNLQLASYLRIAEGVEFIGANLSNNQQDKLIFLFKPRQTAIKQANAYYADTAMVSPHELFRSFSTMKNVIFGDKEVQQ